MTPASVKATVGKNFYSCKLFERHARSKVYLVTYILKYEHIYWLCFSLDARYGFSIIVIRKGILDIYVDFLKQIS